LIQSDGFVALQMLISYRIQHKKTLQQKKHKQKSCISDSV
jgi:hypothetical protein